MPDLTASQLIAMYRLMLLSRRFNERVLPMYRDGSLPHGLHSSMGQEAVGVGACYGLELGDWVIPSLRTVEAFWARGVTVLQQLNTLIGNAASASRGKETSHHAGYPDHGILSGTAIVGASIPMAVGAALALKMQGSNRVVVCFFGDGAANTGDFHEGLNLAAVLKAPVVFICENNSYAMTVPASASMAIADVAVRAAGYGMPGEVVDGQNVIAVYDATQRAVLRARRGEGPTLLECKTYRYESHYPSYKDSRLREEIERWMKRDPITILAAHLKGLGCVDEAKIEDIEAAVQQELDDAFRQAKTTPDPEPEEVFSNLYAEPFESMGL